MDWGVLQTIGVAGLITLLIFRMPIQGRMMIGTGILAGYQMLLDNIWLHDVLVAPHGGLLGSISWSGLLILSTCLADIFQDQK